MLVFAVVLPQMATGGLATVPLNAKVKSASSHIEKGIASGCSSLVAFAGGTQHDAPVGFTVFICVSLIPHQVRQPRRYSRCAGIGRVSALLTLVAESSIVPPAAVPMPTGV